MPIDLPNNGPGGPDPPKPDLIDEPLDNVARDNIDVDCIIGKHIDGTLKPREVPSEGKPYYVTELEVHLTDGSESNYAMGRVVPDGHNRKPDEGNPLKRGDLPDIITIDVDNQLTKEREDTDGEITRIFTGVISNSSRVTKGIFEFMAFWPGFNDIQNGSVEVSDPPPSSLKGTGLETQGPTDYTTAWQYASIIGKRIGQRVTKNGRFGYQVDITDNGVELNDTVYGIEQRMRVSTSYIPITLEGNDEGLLARVVNGTNSVWEVDRYGRFLIGPPTPNGDEPTSITSHKLRYITDTDAGLQSPAWRSIVVIGDGVVSQDGWGASTQINANPQKYAEPVTEAYEPDEGDVLTDGLAEPTFEYTNLEINTADEAKHVLNKLKDEIRKQMSGGEITVVGHPEVWPGDSIEMPDTEDQPFGLERYGVGKVVHRINNSDGFLTKIKVMGQTNANDAIFSDEISISEEDGEAELPPEVPDDLNRYEMGYTEKQLRRIVDEEDEDNG